MNAINAIGYVPDNIKYCPVCGDEDFPLSINCDDGRMVCGECGLVCYIFKADDSHKKDVNE